MTIQKNDRIYIDGKLYELLSTPLKAFFEDNPDIPTFKGKMPGCKRGYVATWRLRNNVLYLTGFQQVSPDIFINANKVLTGPKIFAVWYKGILRIPVGPVIHHYSNGAELHEREIRIYVEYGVVMNHEIVHNQYVSSDKSNNISV